MIAEVAAAGVLVLAAKTAIGAAADQPVDPHGGYPPCVEFGNATAAVVVTTRDGDRYS